MTPKGAPLYAPLIGEALITVFGVSSYGRGRYFRPEPSTTTGTATYKQTPDGRYQVHLSVEAMKYRADGRGQEHTVPVHDLMDIGVLDKDGHFLYLQRQKIDQEKTEFDATVDRLPAKAGIDPLIKLIDRNPDDNVIAVDAQ